MNIKIKCDISKLPEAPYSKPKVPERKKPEIPYETMGHNRQKETKKPYTPEIDAQIIKWKKEQKSFYYMAEKLGRSAGGVLARYRRLNAGGYGKKYRYTPEQDNVIREMRAQGKTWREIADHLGRSRDAIRHRAKIIGDTNAV